MLLNRKLQSQCHAHWENPAFHVYYCTESIVDVAGISTTGCADRKSMKNCAVLVSIMFVEKLLNLCDD